MTRYLCLALLSYSISTQAHAQFSCDPNAVLCDTFDGYASDAELRAAWVAGSDPNKTFLIDPGFPGDPNNPYPILPAKGGLDGKAAFYDGVVGQVNSWSDPNFAVSADANRTIHVSVDIGHDLVSANKRHSLGLRYVDPNTSATSNIIELGFWNSPPTGSPGFAHRAILIPGGDNWQAFTSLRNSVDEIFEVGIANDGQPAFHRFGAIVDPNSITFTLDLFADGVISAVDADSNGDGRVDGLDLLVMQENYGAVGDPNTGRPDGDANRDFTVDSADIAIWEEEYGIVVGVTPGFDAVDVDVANVFLNGPDNVVFNEIRYGGPSGVTSGDPFAAFDNVEVRVVSTVIPSLGQVPEPSSLVLSFLFAGSLCCRYRRRR